MNYQSTRSEYVLSAPEAVLTGIAPDGGLFVDPDLGERSFDWKKCLKLKPLEMQAMLLDYLLPGYEDMDKLTAAAYAGKFETEDLCPVVKAGDFYICELFRGPTSAFKDVALTMLPRLIPAAKEVSGNSGKTVILTATSGDTGKAALEGFRDVDGTEIIVFYPHGGVSDIQRLQMATAEGANVKVCAVRGNFDDCQRGVKKAFAEIVVPEGKELSSANSINIGRLAPQLVYYFISYAKLLESGALELGETVDFAVPTGNFGDILAGWYAKQLGLPVGRLICASNSNNVLTDFLRSGVYDVRRDFVLTSSPSMDILVSSNLERLLFYACGKNCGRVAELMKKLSEDGFYELSEEEHERISASFTGAFATEDETLETIRTTWRESAYLADPHTAVALKAAKELAIEGRKTVVLSTASPFKFPAACLKALGEELPEGEFAQMEKLSAISGRAIPANLAALREKPVLHTDVIGKEEISEYVTKQLTEGIN